MSDDKSSISSWLYKCCCSADDNNLEYTNPCNWILDTLWEYNSLYTTDPFEGTYIPYVAPYELFKGWAKAEYKEKLILSFSLWECFPKKSLIENIISIVALKVRKYYNLLDNFALWASIFFLNNI